MNRVVVLGNSVALVARPPREKKGPTTYPELLPGLLGERGVPCELVNVSERYLTVDGALEDLERRVVALSPDLVILNYGVVEAAPRIVPRPVYFFINRPPYRTSLPRRIFCRAASAAERYLAPRLLRAFGGFRWVGPALFAECLAAIVDRLWKECRCHTVVMNIPEPNDRMESLLPGIRSSTEEYNRIMQQACTRRTAHLLDAASLVRAGGAEAFCPDGVHFSAEGHKAVAEELAELIHTRRLIEA